MVINLKRKKSVITSLFILFAVIAYVFFSRQVVDTTADVYAQTTGAEWTTAGGNPQRTSWSSEQVDGNLVPVWYKTFEPYILPRTQIVAAESKLFIATARGLYALNADTGAELWIFPTQLPLADTPTYVNGIVYIGGLDKKMYAVNASNGTQKWAHTGEQGFYGSPLVVNNTVYAGNRDGSVYAIDVSSGSLKWKYKTNGPVVQSIAYAEGTLYFASQDSYAYALNENGTLKWKSAKLPGGGFQSWWPVVFNNYVIFTGGLFHRPGGPAFENLTGPTWFNVQQIDLWPNYTSIPRGTPVGAMIGTQSWSHGAPVMDLSKSYQGLSTPVSEYLEDDGQVRFDRATNKPWRRTYFLLQRADGKEKTYDFDNDGKPEYVPFTFFGIKGMNNAFPPVVGPDGLLYQFITNKSSTGIAGGGVVGWKVDTPFVSIVADNVWNAQDEKHYSAMGGNVLYTGKCCDRVGEAFDVTKIIPDTKIATRYKYFGYNLPDLVPGYRDKMYYPITDRWNNNDSPYVVFGKNGEYGWHNDSNPPIPYKGRMYLHRSNTVIAWAKTGSANKLAEAKIKSSSSVVPVPAKSKLTEKLEQEITKIVQAGHLRPGYVNSGLVDGDKPWCGEQLRDYWHHPAETLYYLIRALPQVQNSTLKTQLRAYIQKEFTDYPPYTYNHIGWRDGANRHVYDLPPEVVEGMKNFPPATKAVGKDISKFTGWEFNPFAFYGMWVYAREFGGASTIFNTAKSKTILMNSFNTIPSNAYFNELPNVHNAFIAGYIGFCKLEQLANTGSNTVGIPTNCSKQSTLNSLLSLRATQFTHLSPWLADGATAYCRAYNQSRNYIYMVPELADYLNKNALAKVQTAVNEAETWIPYWFVSKVETEYGESLIKNLYGYHGVFQARAKILKQSYTDLAKYIDVPAFERGDLFYIDNLVSALEASGTGPTPPPSSSLSPSASPFAKGDVNQDNQVDAQDMFLILTNLGKSVASISGYTDPAGDTKVNLLDAGYVVRDWGN